MSQMAEDNLTKRGFLTHSEIIETLNEQKDGCQVQENQKIIEFNNEVIKQKNRSFNFRNDILENYHYEYENKDPQDFLKYGRLSQNDEYYNRFQLFMKNHLKLQKVDSLIQRYESNANDRDHTYFKQLLAHIDDYIIFEMHSEKHDKTKTFSSSFFYQYQQTGHRYLRHYQIQQVIKPEVQKEDNDSNDYIVSEENSKEMATIITLSFLKFNTNKYEFEIQNRILQDVILYDVDPWSLLLNGCLSFGDKQFYYTKRKLVNKDNQIAQRFQFIEQTVINKNDLDGYQFLMDEVNESELFYYSNNKYNIDLPADLQIKIEDLEISFIQNATPISKQNARINEYEHLDKQFVIIQTYDYNNENDKIINSVVMIYQLKDTSKPLLIFENGEFDNIKLAFFTIKRERLIIFTLKSQHNHYQIEYKLGERQIKRDDNDYNYKLENDERIKISKNNGACEGKLENMQIDPLSIQVQIEDLQFQQSYFVTKKGKIELIYPLQQREQKEKQNDYDKVIEQIQNHHQLYALNKDIFILYFDNKVSYSNCNEQILNYLKESRQSYLGESVQRIIMRDMIITFKYQSVLDVFIIKNSQGMNPVQKVKNELGDESYLLKLLIENFDHLIKHRIYQNNYYFDREEYISNQYLQEYYLNKKKHGVFSTHNLGYVNQKEFIFCENYLLIDLGDNDQNPFKLLKLYSNDVKDIKLIKYHVSKSSVSSIKY